MKKIQFLPSSINFSAIERGGNDPDDPIGFGSEDPNLLNANKEEALLFILTTLPKDRYRVIALLLYLRELGYSFRYEDMASIWGQSKEAVFQTIQRMQRSLERAGIKQDKVPR